ncbi:MAG: GNAT family N-acetyltransferase [bacterium]
MKKSLKAARVVISPLRAADIEACAEIVGGDPLWQRYGMTRALARRVFQRTLVAGRSRGWVARVTGEVSVARQAGRVVGFIWFRLDGTFHHSGYVRWIAVAPKARGRGVGERLMRYAEDRIFRWGPNVYLLVSDFNVRAQAFYSRLGYMKAGALPDYVVKGITERLYRKTRGPILNQRRREQ